MKGFNQHPLSLKIIICIFLFMAIAWVAAFFVIIQRYFASSTVGVSLLIFCLFMATLNAYIFHGLIKSSELVRKIAYWLTGLMALGGATKLVKLYLSYVQTEIFDPYIFLGGSAKLLIFSWVAIYLLKQNFGKLEESSNSKSPTRR